MNVDDCPAGCWIPARHGAHNSLIVNTGISASAVASNSHARSLDVTEAACKSHVPSALLVRKEKVSNELIEEIKGALQTIPQPCLDALARADYHVLLTPTISAALPAINHLQVRGYEPSVTWSNIYGLFNRSQKRLVLAELAQQGPVEISSLQPLNNKRRRLGIVRHEFGHAVDQYLGNYSHTEEFGKLYKRDAAALNDEQRQSLSYFLQPGESGQEETFAELFAAAGEQGCDLTQDRMLTQCFGDLLPLIRKKLATM